LIKPPEVVGLSSLKALSIDILLIKRHALECGNEHAIKIINMIYARTIGGERFETLFKFPEFTFFPYWLRFIFSCREGRCGL